MSDVPDVNDDQASSLTQVGKYLIIVAAFLGWFFGGTHMAINEAQRVRRPQCE